MGTADISPLDSSASTEEKGDSSLVQSSRKQQQKHVTPAGATGHGAGTQLLSAGVQRNQSEMGRATPPHPFGGRIRGFKAGPFFKNDICLILNRMLSV